jgi:hypothetical protein
VTGGLSSLLPETLILRLPRGLGLPCAYVKCLRISAKNAVL